MDYLKAIRGEIGFYDQVIRTEIKRGSYDLAGIDLGDSLDRICSLLRADREKPIPRNLMDNFYLLMSDIQNLGSACLRNEHNLEEIANKDLALSLRTALIGLYVSTLLEKDIIRSP